MYFSIIFGFTCIIILLVWAIYLKYVEDEENENSSDAPDPHVSLMIKETEAYEQASQPYKPVVRYSGPANPIFRDGIKLAILTPVGWSEGKVSRTKITSEVLKWDSSGRIETLNTIYIPIDYPKYQLSSKVA